MVLNPFDCFFYPSNFFVFFFVFNPKRVWHLIFRIFECRDINMANIFSSTNSKKNSKSEKGWNDGVQKEISESILSFISYRFSKLSYMFIIVIIVIIEVCEWCELCWWWAIIIIALIAYRFEPFLLKTMWGWWWWS